MTQSHEIDMTTGSIPKKILQFAIPLMLTGILQVLFHSADTMVVGRFAGSNSMAAVGSTGSLVNLLTKLFLSISVGASVLCARYYGSKNTEMLSRCAHTAVTLGALLGLMVCLVGVFFSTPLLKLMKTDEEVLPLASLYLKIFFLGTPASMTYNFTAAVLRALGDTDRPLKIMLLSGLVNLVLNVMFVAVLHMDVAGVAIATVLSNYLSAFLVLRLLTRSGGALRLRLKELGLHLASTLEILRIGLPAGINSTLYNFANVTIQSGVNSLGPIAMAGNAAASSVDSLIHTAMTAFYNAAPTFTSQNMGAKQYRRIPKVLFWNMAFSTAIGLSLGILAKIFGTSLLGLYVPVDDPNRAAVIADGIIRLTWVAFPCFLCGVMDVCCGVLRGLGRNWLPMIVSLIGGCGLRIIWVKTAFAAAPSLQRLYLCYPLSWIAVLAVYLCMLVPILHKLKKQEIPSPLL